MKRFLAVFAAAAVLVGVFAVPKPVFADSQTFSSIFFWPATGKNTYLMVHGTDTLHKLQFNFGPVASFGYEPLKMNQAGANAIDDLLVIDILSAIGITEWLQFGVDLPVVPLNEFRDPRATPIPARSNQFDLADMRLELKARFLDKNKFPIGLALVPFMTLPTGNDAHYVGDPGPTGGVKLAIDGQPHKMVGLALNAGYQGGRKVKLRNVEWQNRLLLGAGVDVTPVKGLDIFGEVNAIADIQNHFKDREEVPAEAMLGARYDIGKSGVTLSGGGGTCIVCGVKGAKVRAVLGATYRYNSPKYQRMDEGVVPEVVKVEAPVSTLAADRKEIASVGSVYFGMKSEFLGPKGRAVVDKVISVVNRSNEICRVDVIGYSDNTGQPDENKQLSLERAKAVVSYVKGHGIRPDAVLVAMGRGEKEPVATNETAKGRARNRRVVFNYTCAEYCFVP